MAFKTCEDGWTTELILEQCWVLQLRLTFPTAVFSCRPIQPDSSGYIHSRPISFFDSFFSIENSPFQQFKKTTIVPKLRPPVCGLENENIEHFIILRINTAQCTSLYPKQRHMGASRFLMSQSKYISQYLKVRNDAQFLHRPTDLQVGGGTWGP